MKWYEDPVYIEMCKKAPEIQELWKPAVGDWFYKEDGIGFGLWLICDIRNNILYCSGKRMDALAMEGLVEFRVPESYVWLPHQDQLQEMYARYVADELELANVGRGELMQTFIDFSAWLAIQYQKEDFVCVPTNVFNSGEQLWLAFVMKEKYNKKVWDGKEWRIKNELQD